MSSYGGNATLVKQLPRLRARLRTLSATGEAAIKDVQRGQRRRYAAVIAAVILLWVVVLGFSTLWNSGAFFKLDELSSPDGRYIASVYGKEMTFSHFLFRHRVQTGRDALTLIIDEGGSTASNISYGDSEYLGSWWSPDSEKYVFALRQNGETRLELYLAGAAQREQPERLSLHGRVRLGARTCRF